MSTRVPPWLPLFPLPSIFIPTSSSSTSFKFQPLNQKENAPKIRPKIEEGKLGKFSIENLLPEATKEDAAVTVLPISMSPVSFPPFSPFFHIKTWNTDTDIKNVFQVLPAASLEFVNGGYGVKNPLAGVGTSESTSCLGAGEQGKFVCRICGKVSRKEIGLLNFGFTKAFVLLHDFYGLRWLRKKEDPLLFQFWARKTNFSMKAFPPR